MIIYNLGTESGFLEMNDILEKTHAQIQKYVNEKYDENEKNGVPNFNMIIDENGEPAREPFVKIDDYVKNETIAGVKIKLRAVSNLDVVEAESKVEQLQNENLNEFEDLKRMIDICSDFIKKSVVSISGLQDSKADDRGVLKCDNKETLDLLFEAGLLQAVYRCAMDWQKLTGDEKKTLE